MHSSSSKSAGPAVLHGPALEVDEPTPVVLAEVLLRAARGGDSQLVFLDRQGRESRKSYADLWAESLRVMTGLRAAGLSAGDEVIVHLDCQQQFLAALWGCFLAGMLPLPVPIPPSYVETSGQLNRLGWACESTRRAVVLTCRALAPKVNAWLRQSASPDAAPLVIEPMLGGPCADAWQASAADDRALLLLTSGSTEQPKVVALTHRNLVSTAAATAAANRLLPNDCSLNWLPLAHVGALVFHIRDVFVGANQVHVPTDYVLEQPLRWLDLVARHRASVCWAPNSAFARINELADHVDRGRWDLSCLRVLLNGSEPINYSTARRFLDRLAAHGLSPDCMTPCWGLTETSAAVTFSRSLDRDTLDRAHALVPVGAPVGGTSLRVVDQHGQVVNEGVVGGVQVRGQSVTPGYYRDPRATAAAFTADGWFATGDLGFIRDGELTISGREKTTVIIHGVNYSAVAIEAAVKSMPGVDDAVAAACGVRRDDGDTDELAVFFSPSSAAATNLPQLQQEVRRAILSQLGVNPRHLIALASHQFPKTATGKVDYASLRRQFAEGRFDQPLRSAGAPHRSDAMTPCERQIAAAFVEVLQLADVGPDDHFFELGGDSLRAMQVVARIRVALNVDLPIRALFVAPTVRELARQVEGQGEMETVATRIELAPRAGALPLSFAQQRLWFLEQLDPGNPAYHVSAAVDQSDPSVGAFELVGRLDFAALRRSVETIVGRHESLRTTFQSVDGKPMQVVTGHAAGELPLVDLRTCGPDAGQERIRREVAAQRQPFDLARGPLWRAAVLRLEDERYLLFFTAHHIVCDGWSVGILRRELAACYEAYCHGRTPRLTELRVRYADYALWQRQCSRETTFQSQLAYWRRQLEGMQPLRLPCPTCAAATSNQGSLISARVPRELADSLRTLSHREGVTLFITTLAVFKTLLLRYSGQSDITIGCPIANRGHPDIEPLIGFFVNTLLLRTDLSRDPCFRELLHRVRETALSAFARQDVPFERIVDEFHATRGSGRNPLFDVMFAVHNLPLEPLRLSGLTVRSFKCPTTASRFALQWDLWCDQDGIRVNAFYMPELLDAALVERMLVHFQNLLNSAAANPELRLSELSMLDESERRQLVEARHPSAPAPLRASCVHELFGQQARRAPDAIALASDSERWTYADLDRRSSRWAARLRSAGVGPEKVVGVACESSLERVALLLGILKAGGAYAALDPSSPDARLAELVVAANVTAVVTSREHEARFLDLARCLGQSSGPSALQVICLERAVSTRAVDLPAESEAAFQGSADHLACVMCTSGTAGRPSAVGVLHRGVTRLVRAMHSLDIRADDVFIQLAPLSFDASTFEIWQPLVSGACLVIPSSQPLSLERIARLLDQHHVTTLWLTAGLFRVMVEHQPGPLRRLRRLLAGGDVVSPRAVRQLLAEGQSVTFINGYGPTENTTFSCCHTLSGGEADGRVVPIGRPIADTEAYVLDSNQNPMPAGAVGELYLGGAGLARGYLGQPSLTAERFIPHPFSDQPGARLYRSGDLVRRRSDGVLEFLGRRDRQVKIRGYRCELEEIEAIIREHPSVRDALVATRGDDTAEKQLVAYVATDLDGAASQIRNHCSGRLPPPLVPSVIMALSQLPLTAEGKLDVRKLPSPSVPAAARHAPPRTQTERTLIEIWSEVLKVPWVGIHDSFFESGGDSLSAMQVIARVSTRFHVEVPLSSFFRGPTVAELALAITEAAVKQTDRGVLLATLANVERLSDEDVRVQMKQPYGTRDG